LVADGVMMTTPASLRVLSATFDSPEKAGPTEPRIFGSAAIAFASGGALSGEPAESFSTSSTLQSVFLALYWSRASFAPSRILMPKTALPPVSAPKNAILLPQLFDAVSPPLFELAQAADPATSARMAAPPSTRASPCLKASTPPPSDGHP